MNIDDNGKEGLAPPNITGEENAMMMEESDMEIESEEEEDNNDDELDIYTERNSCSQATTTSKSTTKTVVRKKHKRHNFHFTIKQKIAIVKEAIAKNNKEGTAKKYRVDPSSVRKWCKNIEQLKEKLKVKPNAKTINKGPPVQNYTLEKSLQMV